VLLPDSILRRARVTVQCVLVRIACRTFADVARRLNPAELNSASSMHPGGNP
jgi:hypothetical protein